MPSVVPRPRLFSRSLRCGGAARAGHRQGGRHQPRSTRSLRPHQPLLCARDQHTTLRLKILYLFE